MATVSLLGSATLNTTSGTHTVVATPAASDLIVLVVANTGYTGTTLPTDNNSDGLGTYTLINSAVKASSADTLQFYVRNALIGSASSTTFTHAPGTTTGGGVAVFKITGMSVAGSSAIRQSAIQSNQSGSTTPTPAFSSVALTGNPVIGAVFNATSPATLTPRASYTEAFDSGYSTPTTGLEAMFRSSGETSASIAWGGTSPSAFCDVAVELRLPISATLSESVTNTDTFTSNATPSVALNTPADTATGQSTTPTLNFTGTDVDGDTLEYNVQVDTTNTFDSHGGNIIDNYPSSNRDAQNSIRAGSGSNNGWGQAFTGNGGILGKATFYHQKFGSPTGSVVAKVYAHTGTFGTSGLPTGTALAISDPIDPTTFSTSVWNLQDYTFSGANQITLVNGSNYFVTVEFNAGDTSNFIRVGTDSSSPSATGNATRYDNTSSVWQVITTQDVIFYVVEKVTALLDKFSTIDTGFTAGHPFASGSAKDFTVQAGDALTALTTYYWRVRATDPSGTNAYGAWSSTFSFTTSSGGTTYTPSLTEAVTSSASLLRVPARNLSDAVTNTASLFKSSGRSFTDAVSNTATVLKGTTRALVEAATSTASFLGSIAHTSILTDAVTSADSLLRTLTRNLLETVTSSDTFIHVGALSRTLTEAVTSADTLIKTAGRTLLEVVTNTDLFSGTKPSSLLSGALAYYKLDGDSTDATGNGYDGTDTSVSYSNSYGIINNGASFGGSSHIYGNSVAPSTYNSGFSISGWFYQPSASYGVPFTFQPTVYAGNNIQIIFTGTDIQYTFQNGAGTHTTGGTYSTGAWYHVVITHDASNDKIYVNGTLKSTDSSQTITDSDTLFGIGSGTDGGNAFTGYVDEVGIWGRVLTSTEVTQLYNAGSGFSYPFAAGTLFTQTLTEAITFADTLIRSVGRQLTELITDTATIVRTTTRNLLETITNSDVLSKLSARLLLQTVTSTDTLLAKISARTLTEAITYSATLLRSIGRSLSDAVTSLASLLKTTGRSLLETITYFDTFTSLKARGVTFTEAISYADTLVRAVTRTFTQTVTSSDVFTGFRATIRTFSDAVTSTDTMLRSIGRTLTEAVTGTDVFASARAFARTFTDSVTSTASMIRTTGRTLAQSITTSDTFIRAQAIARTFTETVTLAATVKILRNGLSTFWANATRTTAALTNKVRTNATLINTARAVSSWINKDKS